MAPSCLASCIVALALQLRRTAADSILRRGPVTCKSSSGQPDRRMADPKTRRKAKAVETWGWEGDDGDDQEPPGATASPFMAMSRWERQPDPRTSTRS